MKQSVQLGLLSVAACIASAAAAAPAESLARTTAKPLEPFARCFADAQDRASMPWSFVPKEDGGGTFSNLGAQGTRHPYFLDVADKGTRREIRLRPASADAATAPSVLRAVDSCI